MIGRQVICSRCRRVDTCRAVLDVQHAPRRVFCDQACMVLFVREVYIEADSTARATALAADSPSAVGMPAASGGAQGRGLRGSGPPVQAPPTSERYFGAFRRAVRL